MELEKGDAVSGGGGDRWRPLMKGVSAAPASGERPACRGREGAVGRAAPRVFAAKRAPRASGPQALRRSGPARRRQ